MPPGSVGDTPGSTQITLGEERGGGGAGRETASWRDLRQQRDRKTNHFASHIKKPSLPNVTAAGYQSCLCFFVRASRPSWFDLLCSERPCQVSPATKACFCGHITQAHSSRVSEVE